MIDVRHPEFADVGRSSVRITSADTPDQTADRSVTVSLILIEQIAVIEVPSAG
jgi:hypothetical protein